MEIEIPNTNQDNPVKAKERVVKAEETMGLRCDGFKNLCYVVWEVTINDSKREDWKIAWNAYSIIGIIREGGWYDRVGPKMYFMKNTLDRTTIRFRDATISGVIKQYNENECIFTIPLDRAN